jgi:hypothetical protein
LIDQRENTESTDKNVTAKERMRLKVAPDTTYMEGM